MNDHLAVRAERVHAADAFELCEDLTALHASALSANAGHRQLPLGDGNRNVLLLQLGESDALRQNLLDVLAVGRGALTHLQVAHGRRVEHDLANTLHLFQGRTDPDGLRGRTSAADTRAFDAPELFSLGLVVSECRGGENGQTEGHEEALRLDAHFSILVTEITRVCARERSRAPKP